MILNKKNVYYLVLLKNNKQAMKKKKIIPSLKVISLILFLFIAVHGPHVSVPFGLVIFIIIWDFFENMKSLNLDQIEIILSLVGLILVLLSIRIKRNYLVSIGYLLTYVMILGCLFRSNVLQKPQNNTYFFITSGIYIIISLYIIFHTVLTAKKINL